MILWIKAFHVIAMVAWFAGLFYLPRLFVYHCQLREDDKESHQRFATMERKLYRAIMNPAMMVTVALGTWLIYLYGWEWFKVSHWLHAKLTLIILLIGFHHFLGKTLKNFAAGANQRSEKFFRIINEVPVVPLVLIVILAVVRPF